METPHDPAAEADEAARALRALAHATRSIDDPRQIYSVLGSLTTAVASLRQSLHQIAARHEHPSVTADWVAVAASRGHPHRGYRVAWELHRAGEIVHQVSTTINHAHSTEAEITYAKCDPPPLSPRTRSAGQGLGL